MNPITLPRAWGHEPPAAQGKAGRWGDADGAAGLSDDPCWLLQRRCSLSPRQFGTCFVGLAGLSALVALFFWAQGAPFVTLFAGIEVTALGVAFAFHALHAADGERLRLQDGRLLIERREGLRLRLEALELNELRVREGSGGTIELRVRGHSTRVGRHADAARRRQVLAELRQQVMQAVQPLPVRT